MQLSTHHIKLEDQIIPRPSMMTSWNNDGWPMYYNYEPWFTIRACLDSKKGQQTQIAHIAGAVAKCCRENNISVEAFIFHLNEEQPSTDKNRKHYTFLQCFQQGKIKNLNSMTVLGNSVRLIPGNEISDKLIELYQAEIKHSNHTRFPPATNFDYLAIKISAESKSMAIDIGWNTLQCWLGLVNTSSQLRFRHFQIQGINKGQLQRGPYLFLTDTLTDEADFWVQPENIGASTGEIDLNSVLIPELAKLVEPTKASGSRKGLRQAIGLIQAGLESNEPWDRLLRLWQALESLSNKGSTGDIVSYLSNYAFPKDPIALAQLSFLGHIRNQYVHKAEFNERDWKPDEILLNVVCRAVFRLESVSRKYSGRKLELFRYVSSLPQNELELLEDVIESMKQPDKVES